MDEKKRRSIMLVDDNQANLNIGKNMLKDSYEVFALPSAERLFKFLEAVTPDLILLDVEMPDMNGFEVIKKLKENEKHKNIPVIFVTAQSQEVNELVGLSLGAVDYVTKPFSAGILLKRIENHLLIEKQKAELKDFNDNLLNMVKEKTARISALQNTVVNTIAEIVEFRDNCTGEHINRTQKYVELLINSMLEHNIYYEEVSSWDDIDYIVSSAQLHDIGKIFISEAILNKPGKLTPEEFETMKTHVTKGVEAVKSLRRRDGGDQSFLRYAEIIIGTHHEKWDGGGYPKGLKGLDIPLLGRIMAVADVYDALTTERPYKPKMSPKEAAEIIIQSSGTHFDPFLINLFKRIEDKFALIAESLDNSPKTE